MTYYKNFDYSKLKFSVYTHFQKLYDDNIYSFDIETTSVFYDGTKIFKFDYNLSNEDYSCFEPLGYMYIWQFSINENVIFGRTWNEFIEFLTALTQKSYGIIIIYVHNLAFEFQFLRNVINDFEVFARQNRHPIYCCSNSFKCEFRCSLFLTQSKLENLPKMFDLPINKLTGDLDYNIIRNSQTILTDKELSYCENDCLVLYYLIKHFKEIYKHVYNIPLTQTGILRRKVRNIFAKNTDYHKKLKYQLPNDFEQFNFLMAAFAGGYVHANRFYANRVVKNVLSMDIASSYPTVIVSEKYPCSMFSDSRITKIEEIDKNKCYIIDITFIDISSKLQNNYLSISKSINIYNSTTDNGRLMQADEARYIITDVDLNIILKCYNFTAYKINRIKVADKDYLNIDFIKYVLELYENKTKFKNVKGLENKYMESKQFINAMFGMCCTNIVTDTVVFNDNFWADPHKLTESETDKKLLKIINSKNTFLSPAWGIFITAYARANLWNVITKIDSDVIYCDTDSIKHINNHSDIFDEYNKNITEKLYKMCDYYNIDKKLLAPVDSFGISHPLGFFENDEKYLEFKTLGAKKYCYKNLKNEIGLTVSGVNKKTGVKAIKKVDDFKKGLLFDYETSGKNLLQYNEIQSPIILEDEQRHIEERTEKYGINLRPTTYLLGIQENYDILINDTLHLSLLERGIEK